MSSTETTSSGKVLIDLTGIAAPAIDLTGIAAPAIDLTGIAAPAIDLTGIAVAGAENTDDLQTTAPSDTKHGAFVCFAEPDAAWVEGYLLDALQAAGIDVITEAAFALGVPRLSEFERAVQTSRYTILVLSPAFQADNIADFANSLGQCHGVESGTWPVIPLVLDRIDLPLRLEMLTRIDASDPKTRTDAIDKLCEFLGHAPPPPPAIPPCPYPGMAPFSRSMAKQFYGRKVETKALLLQLHASRFATVIGASGSGKSSLVFAGLIPEIEKSTLFGQGHLLVRTMRPGPDPHGALCRLLGSETTDRSATELFGLIAASAPETNGVLLVIDQFEELFSVGEEQSAAAFQTLLLALSEIEFCYVILTVRADFYERLMTSALWKRISATRFELLPLGPNALHEAIEEPAKAAKVFLDPALTERLVNEAADGPGMLPFVQETLVLLWNSLDRRYLALSSYEALVLPAIPGDSSSSAVPVTGLQVALSLRANDALADLDSEEKRQIAKRIFLRLVNFGYGRANTRRKQPIDSLVSDDDNLKQFHEVLDHLVDRRLITLSGDDKGAVPSADLAHEIVITGWPSLAAWIKERREAELDRRKLELKATDWTSLGRSEAGLLDEALLVAAKATLSESIAADLGHSAEVDEFVNQSALTIERAKKEREDTAQRELVAAQSLAHERLRGRNRARAFAIVASVLLVASIVAAVLAKQQTRRARAATVKAKAATAVAQAQALAGEAVREANLYADDVSTLKAALAYGRISQSTPEIDESLRNVLYTPRRSTKTLINAAAAPSSDNCWRKERAHEWVSFSASGTEVLAISRNLGLRRWSVDSSTLIKTLPLAAQPTGFVNRGQFAMARCPNDIRLYDTSSLNLSSIFKVKLGREDPFDVSADGAVAAYRSSLRSIKITSQSESLPLGNQTLTAPGAIRGIAMSPTNGAVIAWGEMEVWLWSIDPSGSISKTPHTYSDVANANLAGPPLLSDDGQSLAIRRTTGATVYSLRGVPFDTTGVPVPNTESASVLDDRAAFSKDGSQLALVDRTGLNVYLWAVSPASSTWGRIAELHFRETIEELSISPNNKLLATVTANGVARVTRLSAESLSSARVVVPASNGARVTGLRYSTSTGEAVAWLGSNHLRWKPRLTQQVPASNPVAVAGFGILGAGRLSDDGTSHALYTPGDLTVTSVSISDSGKETQTSIGTMKAGPALGSIDKAGNVCLIDTTGALTFGTVDQLDAGSTRVGGSAANGFRNYSLDSECSWLIRTSTNPVAQSANSPALVEVFSIAGKKVLPFESITLDTTFTAVALHSSRKIIAFGGADGSTRIWSFGEHAKTVAMLRSTQGTITTLSFSEDGQTLAIGDTYGTLRVAEILSQNRSTGKPSKKPASRFLSTTARLGRSEITDIAWTTDQEILYGTMDGEILSVRPTKLLAQTACEVSDSDRLQKAPLVRRLLADEENSQETLAVCAKNAGT
jgi:WD40 repeat protein